MFDRFDSRHFDIFRMSREKESEKIKDPKRKENRWRGE
jgi:hypothetical protein